MVGPVQIIIVALLVVVLFGGTRLGRLGRGGGRQLRRTKESLVDAGKGFREELAGDDPADHDKA